MFLIRSLVAVGLLVASVPVVFGVTLVLLPLWSWIEASTGIESVGHSGPSDWCFWLVFGAIATPLTLAVFAYRRPPDV